jgi:diguanylate cyclase
MPMSPSEGTESSPEAASEPRTDSGATRSPERLSSPQSQRGGDHWVVRMNHRNRTAAFAVAFAALATHAWDRHDGPLVWIALAANFLVGPHVLYLVARRHRDPLRAEIRNTMIDAGAFGFWSGAFAFPLWVTFIFFVGSIVNPGAFRGRKGLAQGIASFAGGALVGAAIAGFRVEPATSPTVTALCIASVLLFLVTVALGTYDRAVRLSDARTRLRQNERALCEQLDAIRGLEAKLREQADRDPLTGLFNRRYLEPALERELVRCKRASLPLTVMIVDVDHFKRINDHYGHPAGDAVLRALADLLQSTVRASDVACRFGGEEFLLLLPEMPAEAAVGCAERLRARWETSPIRAGKHTIASTLSIGFATYPGRADTPESLVKAADLALYDAKRSGRNRAIAYLPIHGSLGKPAPPPPADAAMSAP